MYLVFNFVNFCFFLFVKNFIFFKKLTKVSKNFPLKNLSFFCLKFYFFLNKEIIHPQKYINIIFFLLKYDFFFFFVLVNKYNILVNFLNKNNKQLRFKCCSSNTDFKIKNSYNLFSFNFFNNVKFSVTNLLSLFNFFFFKEKIYFFRKELVYSKGRYSRNRQVYRTGVYWCLYINIIAVISLYF